MRTSTVRALWLTAKRAGLRRSLYRVRRRLQLRLLDPLLAPLLYSRPQIVETNTVGLQNARLEWCKRILALRTLFHASSQWDTAAQTVTLLNQRPFPLRLPIRRHDSPTTDPLWLFQLHSWDWAWSETDSALRNDVHGAAGRDALVELWRAWLSNLPVGRGLAWEPYPTSRRLLVWSVVWHFTGKHSDLAAAIAQHAAYLADHFERDLENNHLIVNAKALIWVGLLLPHLPRARAWQQQGLETFWQAFVDQVRPDGGHVENSTSYHLSLLLDGVETALLCQISGQSVSAEHLRILAKMCNFARALLRPDGQLPLLNDAVALDRAATDAVFALADEVGIKEQAEAKRGIEAFVDSGIAVLRAGSGSGETYLLFDAGNLGPEHCPGHGHADTLSFELWHGTQPLVIDPGTFQYAAGEWRDYFRSTAAHSTATVDGQNQSTFVGPFRLDHLARGSLLSATESEGLLEVVGEHDGYLRLPDPVIHRRRIRLHDAKRILIEDSFSGHAHHEIVLRLHLAPCTVEIVDQATVALLYPSGLRMRVEMHAKSGTVNGRWQVEEGWQSQTWYQKEPTPVLAFKMKVQLPLSCTMEMRLKR